jgi:hypothetical protein
MASTTEINRFFTQANLKFQQTPGLLTFSNLGELYTTKKKNPIFYCMFCHLFDLFQIVANYLLPPLTQEEGFWTQFSARFEHILENDVKRKSDFVEYIVRKQLQAQFTKSCLKEELMATMFHPKNIVKFKSWGFA